MFPLIILMLFGGLALVWAGFTGQSIPAEFRRILGGAKK